MTKMNVESLPEAIVEAIFALACATTDNGAATTTVYPLNSYKHIPDIPQVCRRWESVYTNSLLLWADTTLDWSTVFQRAPILPLAGKDQAAKVNSVFSWLHKRSKAFVRLTLKGCHQVGISLDSQIAQLCWAAPRLQHLTVADAQGNLSSLQGLMGAANLKTISIHAHLPRQGSVVKLHIDASAIASLSSLVHLESLDISFDHLSGNPTDLTALARLPNLTSVKLCSRSESTLLPPEVLIAFHNLKQLDLENFRLPQISPTIVHALSNVTHLSLTSVLAAMPRRKSGRSLWDVLRHLPHLEVLKIKDAGQNAGLPGNALACPSLKSLTLLGCKELNTWQVGQMGTARAMLGYHMPLALPLKELHLQDCTLDPAEMPQRMPELGNLTDLTWSNIRESAPIDLHAQGPSPRRLLHYPNLLWSLPNLTTLRLEYCGLSHLPWEQASNLARLERLSLEGNPLARGEWESFVAILNSQALTSLSLANTGLELLPLRLNEVWNKLERLNLERTFVAWEPVLLRQLQGLPLLKQVSVGAAPAGQHWYIDSMQAKGLFTAGESMSALIP